MVRYGGNKNKALNYLMIKNFEEFGIKEKEF